MAWRSRWLVPTGCTLFFVWLSTVIERHSFAEFPGPSWALLLSVSGLTLQLSGTLTFWLPGIGRFRQQEVNAKTQRGPLALPFSENAILIGVPGLVVARLALLNFVMTTIQCSNPGPECLLPMTLVAGTRLVKQIYSEKTLEKKSDDDYDDMSRTIWEDFGRWLWSWSYNMSLADLGVVLVSIGAFFAAQLTPRSTAFCSAVSDTPGLTVLAQYLGMAVEATVLILFGDIILSARPFTSRLQMMGQILLFSGTGVFATWITSVLFHTEASALDMDTSALSLLILDGLVLALLIVYVGAILPMTGSIAPVVLIIFVYSSWRSLENIALIPSFHAVSKGAALIPFLTLCIGIGIWFASGALTTETISCTILVILSLAAGLACIIMTVLADRTVASHPLNTRIFRARIEQDRWERYAGISQSFRTAVIEYKERHGRDPPVGFDKWFEFARDRQSVVIDHFEQLRRDMEPFWSLQRGELVARLEEITSMSGVETIVVHDRKVTSRSDHSVVRGMESMISLFSKHLPDMEIPINVAEQARILAPWRESGLWRSRVEKLRQLDRRDNSKKAESDNDTGLTSPTVYRHMIADTCPPFSPLQTYHYNIRDFCDSCSELQSKTLFLRYHQVSLQLCHQSDILLLHDHHLFSPAEKPIRKLLPLFSRTKTEFFSDILLPLNPPHTDPELVRADNKPFRAKKSRLYWRGHMPGTGPEYSDYGMQELARNGHTERLLHLVNNATEHEKVTLMIPTLDHAATGHFTYEHISTRELNEILPFDVRHLPANATAGEKPHAKALVDEFGEGAAADSMLNSRYILVQDTANGPPPANFLRMVMASKATPFLASIFREWYTERLYPWVHFVPVDLRWHALHGTLAYFTGLSGEMTIPGHDGGSDGKMGVGIDGRWKDGEWISDQGAKWMNKVARDEDMAIYTFRALLEWGRLLSSNRSGFIDEQNGPMGFDSD